MRTKEKDQHLPTRRKFLSKGALALVGISAAVLTERAETFLNSPRFVSNETDIVPASSSDVMHDGLLQAGRDLLRKNTEMQLHNEREYTYVVPNRTRYNNYWHWDHQHATIISAFISPTLAGKLIQTQDTIFRHDGVHGPQIMYLNQSKYNPEYFGFLQTRANEKGVDQLTQTPLSAIALETYALKTTDYATVQKVLPSYAAHYSWLHDERVIDGNVDLPVVIDPRESLDAQPAVDFMYERRIRNNLDFQQLAARTLYHARTNGYDARKIAYDDGFVMYDTCFISYYVRSLFALRNLWKVIGDTNQARIWNNKGSKALHSFIDLCYNQDDGIFYNRRANKNRETLKVKTASGFYPLLCQLPPDIVERLVDTLVRPEQFVGDEGYLPFVAKNEQMYQEAVSPLWRGPGSPIDPFVISYGLYTNGQPLLAERLLRAQYRMFIDRFRVGAPFAEFFTPEKSYRDPYVWGIYPLCDPFELVSEAKDIIV